MQFKGQNIKKSVVDHNQLNTTYPNPTTTPNHPSVGSFVHYHRSLGKGSLGKIMAYAFLTFAKYNLS
jgi:hypothetical protein